MPVFEKLSQPSQARHWNDSIPLEYHYTAGVAGEEFRRELRDNGRFLAAKCSKCKNAYVPARLFCPQCFIEMKDLFPINNPGYVESFTVVDRGRDGSEAEHPTILALVRFESAKGGIIHRLQVDPSDQVMIGMRVHPLLKEKSSRTGALDDILAFKPLK